MECWEQPAAEVFDFLEHLGEHPPAYLILSAVHLKPKPKPGRVNQLEFRRDLPELHSMLGQGAPMPVTPEMRDAIDWMKRQQQRMKM